MNNEIKKMLDTDFDGIGFGIYNNELISILKSINDAKKVVSKKNEAFSKYYDGIFINKFNEREYKDFLLSDGIPCGIGVSDEKKDIGIYINKIGIMITIGKSIGIPVENFLTDTSQEDTYNKLKTELRRKKQQIKNITTLDGLKKEGLISDEALNTVKKYNPLVVSRTVSKITEKMCKDISSILIDLKIVMEKNELELTDKIAPYIDKDKLYLWLAGVIIKRNNDKTLDPDFHKHATLFIIEYYKNLIKKDNNRDYSVIINHISLPTKQSYTTKNFLDDYAEFYENYLFNNQKQDDEILKKLVETPPTNFLLDWEIIPNGHKEYEKSNKNKYQKISTMGDLKASKEEINKQKERLLQEKVMFFTSTCPIIKIKGTNKMDGYYGYIYANGKVIFEKFNSNKSEAIYVMRIDNFKELSKYTKSQLISYINTNDNPNIKRIYHSKNWKEKVVKEINKKETNINELEKLKKAREELVSQNKDEEKIYIKRH